MPLKKKEKTEELVSRVETHIIDPKDVRELFLWLYRDPSKDEKDEDGNVVKKDEGEFMRAVRLYNKANYILRQAYTKNDQNIPNYMDIIHFDGTINMYDLVTMMRALEEPEYMALAINHSAQQAVFQACLAFKGWFAALKQYKRHPGKFLGEPRMPGPLKRGKLNKLVYTKKSFQVNCDGFLTINKIPFPIHTKLNSDDIQQVTLIPYHIDRVKVEINYRTTREKQVEKKGYDNFHGLDFFKALAVDLGVGNLLTITSDDGSISNIVNGGRVKSDNRYYNKCRAQIKSALDKQGLEDSKRLRRLERRHLNKLKDFFHKAAKRVVEMMVYWGIGTCIVGLNEGWKQRLNHAGEVNNQNFLQIPYSMFVEILRYKVEEIGCRFMTVNESYTSKCSAYDKEEVCKHEEYFGNRTKRGAFITAYGIHMVNADINGSLNILRKGMKRDIEWHKSYFNPRRMDIEQRYAQVRLSCRIARRGTNGSANGSSDLKVQNT